MRIILSQPDYKNVCRFCRPVPLRQDRKKVQLIGMNRYESGNASNDGSGELSINLLTHDYIGNWNYFDQDKMKLVKIPAIKCKMPFKTVYLENFSEGIYTPYADKCAKLYNLEKKPILRKR